MTYNFCCLLLYKHCSCFTSRLNLLPVAIAQKTFAVFPRCCKRVAARSHLEKRDEEDISGLSILRVRKRKMLSMSSVVLSFFLLLVALYDALLKQVYACSSSQSSSFSSSLYRRACERGSRRETCCCEIVERPD